MNELMEKAGLKDDQGGFDIMKERLIKEMTKIRSGLKRRLKGKYDN